MAPMANVSSVDRYHEQEVDKRQLDKRRHPGTMQIDRVHLASTVLGLEADTLNLHVEVNAHLYIIQLS
jgi:hypothetical protein